MQNSKSWLALLETYGWVAFEESLAKAKYINMKSVFLLLSKTTCDILQVEVSFSPSNIVQITC